ncbi:MAG: hypothetical protein IT303_14230, partial [Dehalococcoidia bacterium]|nr:hypothetical protein [Dehalococcoidia bacterium]
RPCHDGRPTAAARPTDIARAPHSDHALPPSPAQRERGSGGEGAPARPGTRPTAAARPTDIARAHHRDHALPPSPARRERGSGGEGLLAAVLAALLALAGATLARADGEVGLVIQEGDAVTGLCIPYTGDSIRGDQLLAAAGISVEQYGGGARTVCALDEVGCFDASSFNGCFCQCSGGACTYWAFFTKKYGAPSWVYSTSAFNQQLARDGDMHAWKWGEGSLQSAPVPRNVTFEDVCGHAPRGGAAVTQVPETATTAPPATATTVPATAATGSATAPPATATTATTTASPSLTASSTGTPATITATMTGTAATPASVTTADITIARPSPTAQLPATGDATDDGGDGGGSSAAPLVAFGAVALVLVAGIGAALAWRRTHGA